MLLIGALARRGWEQDSFDALKKKYSWEALLELVVYNLSTVQHGSCRQLHGVTGWYNIFFLS